jgi:YfiH family protein
MEYLIEENGKKYFKIPLNTKGSVNCWFSTKSFAVIGSGCNTGNADNPFILFLSSKGVTTDRMISLKQVHGNGVIAVNEEMLSIGNGGEIGIGDALISDLPGTPLMIKVADCISIQIYDPDSGAIGNIHCGWRSSAQNIIGQTISRLRELYNFNPGKARALMMPSISSMHYQVGKDVYEAFVNSFDNMKRFFNQQGSEKWLFDLRGAALMLLLGTGIDCVNVIDLNLCTFNRPEMFYSYRRDGNSTGRMYAVIEKR